MKTNDFYTLQDSNVVEKTSAIPEKLDIKNLKVPELRAELAARNLSTKGIIMHVFLKK